MVDGRLRTVSCSAFVPGNLVETVGRFADGRPALVRQGSDSSCFLAYKVIQDEDLEEAMSYSVWHSSKSQLACTGACAVHTLALSNEEKQGLGAAGERLSGAGTRTARTPSVSAVERRWAACGTTMPTGSHVPACVGKWSVGCRQLGGE